MNVPLRPLVVEWLPRRSEPMSSLVTIPEPAALALAAITRDMRDVPRDCLRDPAELLHWLRRMANRVEGVATMKLPEPPRVARRALACQPATPTRAITARQAAEAVFASPSKACAAKGLKDETLHAASAPTIGKYPAVGRRPATRTVTNRKGRAVPVEIRKARAGGQMELGV